ncbi:MAG TPA: RagB/SusD family nutrient uptake outer membrane protein, partial [Parasegetibacter sp.]
MRKTILYIIISLLILPGLTSCNKWLDVQPQNSVSEDNLFNSKEGFRNALNGIYLSLVEPSLYGAELTYATMSALSYNYRITSGTYLTTMQFDYEHSQVRPRLDKFWEGLYNAIANCNNLLVNIENKNAEDFIDGLQEKNLIKGEALALRGFLHFELLRLYAPSIAVDAQGRYIPYYTTYPSHGETKISSMEVLNRAAEDLKLGRDLVAPYDTITAGYSAFASPEARLSNNSNGAFYSRRGTRLNYFAITGILARLYLYANDKTNALKYAQEIV